MVQVSVKDCSYVKLGGKKSSVYKRIIKKNLSVSQIYKCAVGSGFGIFPLK